MGDKMRKIKLIAILLSIIVLSGCSVNYTINIDESSFNEKISISDFITATRTIEKITTSYQEYYPTTIEGVADLNSLICESIEKCYKKSLALQSNTGYIYNLENSNSLDNFVKTTSWLFSNNTKSFLNDENNIIISTSNGLKYFDLITDLTEINITLETDLNVVKNNADIVNGTSYTWVFTRENYLTKNIFINIEKKKEDNQDSENKDEDDKVNEEEIVNENKNNKYAIFIIIGILIVYFIIIRLIIKKKR